MLKALTLILLVCSVSAADPFNTIPAFTLETSTGYLGPYLPVALPLERNGGGEGISCSPALYAGYGLFTRCDAILTLDASFTREKFSFGSLALEPRYELFASERLSITPVVDVSLPLTSEHSFGVAPGIMLSVLMGPVYLHANLFYSLPITDSLSELAVLVAPEFGLGESFSLYIEGNAYHTISDSETTVELWPGISWSLGERLSINLACGIPTTTDYLIPGLALYLNF